MNYVLPSWGFPWGINRERKFNPFYPLYIINYINYIYHELQGTLEISWNTFLLPYHVKRTRDPFK